MLIELTMLFAEKRGGLEGLLLQLILHDLKYKDDLLSVHFHSHHRYPYRCHSHSPILTISIKNINAALSTMSFLTNLEPTTNKCIRSCVIIIISLLLFPYYYFLIIISLLLFPIIIYYS